MGFNDTSWGTIGKIAGDDNLFAANLSLEDVMDGSGFTSDYSKLVGEQVFKPTQTSETPFSNNHIGAPVKAGAGWIERLVKRLGTGTTTAGSAKAGMMHRPDAREVTADDNLRFYDSEGKEFVYQTENVAGWCPVSLPSDLDLRDMFLNEGFNQFNSMLVDAVKQAYDRSLESEIQKVAVTLAPKYEQVSEEGSELFRYLRDTVSKFKSDDYDYNLMSEQDNIDYEHRSNDVIIYMNRIKYNEMMDGFSNLPSPEYINQTLGASIVLMDNAMLTPYASVQQMNTEGFTKLGGITAGQMPMLGKSAPDVMIMDKRWIEYRPFASSYRVNIIKNAAGDFQNEHLLYKGGLNVRPWANCLAVELA